MRIHSLTLATSELTGQAAFWGDTLGLPVDETGDDALEVSLQASTIRFEQAPVGTDPRYHFAINVPRGSIDDAAGWMVERHEVLAFHGDPDVEEGATIVHTDRGASALYFLDGGGNVAELIANDRLGNETTAPFDQSSLLEIAEIGVATANTDATRAAIQDAFVAEILWGGREGWLLTAIGDDHGVVIVAPTGRGLDPDRPAGAPVPDDDRGGRPGGARADPPRRAIHAPHRSRVTSYIVSSVARRRPSISNSLNNVYAKAA